MTLPRQAVRPPPPTFRSAAQNRPVVSRAANAGGEAPRARPQSKDKLTAESIILSGFSTRDAGGRPCLRDVDGVPVIEPSLLDLLRSVRDSITALGDKFGHVKARTTAIEQRLADVEAVLLQRRARGEPPLEDALQLFERLKARCGDDGLSPPFGKTLDEQRERLLSALPPRDRKIVERLMAEHPTLTARRAIEGLTAFGGL